MAERVAASSTGEVTCKTVFRLLATGRHKLSHAAFRPSLGVCRHLWKAPLGDHTSGRSKARPAIKVGIIGKEYTAERCATSAHRMLGRSLANSSKEMDCPATRRQ